MSVRDEIINAIIDELSMSYQASGRVIPTTITVIAGSLADAIDWKSVDVVKAAFRKARDTEAIPLQGTLKSIVDSMRRLESRREVLEYKDPRWPWLPESIMLRRVNFDEAVKRLCIAQGESEYKRYVDSTGTRYNEHRRVVYANPRTAIEFLREKAEFIKDLYMKYIRDLPEYRSNPEVGNSGFPKDAKLNYGLKPPEVYQFREMLEKERRDYEWQEVYA